MKRPSLLLGALLGGLTSLPLIALFYLGKQWAGLPFVPFDLFDWLARVLPGQVIRIGIDTMVRTIGRLRLGPTAAIAKAMEQLQGIVLVVVICVLLGLLMAWLLRRLGWPGWRVGVLASAVVWVLVMAMTLSLRAVTALDIAWLALLIVGWGAVVGTLLERQLAPVPAEPSTGRRAVLATIAGGSVATALAAWGLARLVGASQAASSTGKPVTDLIPQKPMPTPLPTPAGRLEPAPDTRPEITDNDAFYRIDINTLPIHVDIGSWKLDLLGMFDRPRSLTLVDLLAFRTFTQPITLSCISNPVGGDLISTGYWTGVRLRDVVADLGLQSGTQGLYVKSADGFYEFVVLQDIMLDQTLLVYGMNGVTLPAAHGFPLRIYIPNRYGMKQPKWMVSMEAIAQPRTGYWVDRGWSQEARPQIVSVIDTVSKSNLVGDKIPVGGIAWAGSRGVEKVELQVDDGAWVEASLRVPPLGPLTWVQWRYDWPYAKGRHRFSVRATDGTGTLQTSAAADTFPNGATGYHTVTADL